MPLSEHEQRLLEQMERALYAEDPKFATSMRSARSTAGDRRRVALGVLAFLVGLALLVAGVATHEIVGVIGFLAMLGGLWLAIAAMKTSRQSGQPVVRARTPGAARPARRPRRKDSLSDRMEERWRRRRENGDF